METNQLSQTNEQKYCELITSKQQIYDNLSGIDGNSKKIDSLVLWNNKEKIDYAYKIITELGKKGLKIYFANYYTINQDSENEINRKPWELEKDSNNYIIRPVPVGELDTQNNIYLNIKNIGYLSGFLTILHLYGHRIQGHIMDYLPDSPDGQKYKAITKYVSRPKPLNMSEVYEDYHKNINKVSDYEQDFLGFEKEAFEFGIGLCEYTGIHIDEIMQYLINVYIETDFDEIKQRWGTQVNKSGVAFNERFIYNYNSNKFKVGGDYINLLPKAWHNSFNDFASKSGVIVIRE